MRHGHRRSSFVREWTLFHLPNRFCAGQIRVTLYLNHHQQHHLQLHSNHLFGFVPARVHINCLPFLDQIIPQDKLISNHLPESCKRNFQVGQIQSHVFRISLQQFSLAGGRDRERARKIKQKAYDRLAHLPHIPLWTTKESVLYTLSSAGSMWTPMMSRDVLLQLWKNVFYETPTVNSKELAFSTTNGYSLVCHIALRSMTSHLILLLKKALKILTHLLITLIREDSRLSLW